jgi:hypothetical protein
MAGGFEVLSEVARYNARAFSRGGGEDFIPQNWTPKWLWDVLPPANSSE